MRQHVAAVPLAAFAAAASGQTIDFPTALTTDPFGTAAGSAVGDTVGSQDGITITAEEFLLGPGVAPPVAFGTAQTNGFASGPGLLGPDGLTLSNINARFETSGLGIVLVEFDYVDLGGEENLGVNGSVSFLEFQSAAAGGPIVLGGATVTITSSLVGGGAAGSVRIEGPIADLTVGGQEFGIENLTFTVPGPGAAVVLGAAGLALTRRRR